MRNKDEVKAAAAGQWRAICRDMGMPDEVMDAKHHPCPRCGGTDRFRVFDDFESTGGVICNQCLRDAGDGFATVGWLQGVGFVDSVKLVADWLGLASPKKRAPVPVDFQQQVTLSSWSPDAVPFYCAANPGISAIGLERAGTVQGTYHAKAVLLYQIWGEDLQSLTGYVAMSLMSATLPKWSKDGTAAPVRKLNVRGSKPGIVGAGAVRLLQAGGIVDTVWKVEGPTDLAALCSVIPESQWGNHVVVTTACGARENPRWISQFLCRARRVIVIHDRDDAGEIGANKWVAEIRACGGHVKRVDLPYEMVATRGRDLRDFLLEGPEPWGRLQALAQSVPWPPRETNEPLAKRSLAAGEIPAKHQACLDALGMDVLCEDEHGIHVYSLDHKKTDRISSLRNLTQEELIRIVGIRGEAVISEEDDESKYSIRQVRHAVAMAAAARRVDSSQSGIRGIGLYRATDFEGQGLREVVIANGTHLTVLDEHGTVLRVDRPRHQGLLFRFGSRDWYDHNQLAEDVALAKADPTWVRGIWETLTECVGRWTWAAQDRDPELVAGLIGATWAQDFWAYRPQVSVRGASNAGKSQFASFAFGIESQPGIFGPLAFRRSMPSAAGLRQAVGRSSRAICVDEWDSIQGKARAEMLRLLRTATSGDTITMGSTSHRSVEFGLRACVWLVGVHVGLDAQMDANRFIPFELVRPDEERWRAWKSPSQEVRTQLRRGLMAIAAAWAIPAADVAAKIRREIETECSDRLVEGLAAPVALMALSSGGSHEDARVRLQLLCDAMEQSSREETGQEQHLELVQQILGLPVHCGGGAQMTASQILDEVGRLGSQQYADQLESQLGLALKRVDGVEWLVVHHGGLQVKLQESGAAIRQILLRVPGAHCRVAKVARAAKKCCWLPYAWVTDQFLGDEDAPAEMEF